MWVVPCFIFYIASAQTDTLYFDSGTDNYLIKYLGETEIGQDTVVHLIYEPPTKINPIINCFVSSTVDGKYLYRYKITNGNSAVQNLREFSLHYDSAVWIESRTPLSSWRNRGRQIVDYSIIDNPKTVYSWVWRGDQGLESTWYVDSCIITSDGLPSFMDSYSQAKTRTWSWPAGGPNNKDTIASDIRIQLLRLRSYPNDNVYRKTIGPKMPPRAFPPILFIDSLISYKHQSRALGWIDNDGIMNSMDQKLENAKKQLEKGNTNAAANIVQSFINEVEAQKDKHLSSEAYALLKYNAEYLLEKLGGK